MLDPDVRHLLTDALKPPAGTALDVAVATTYSLDLNSLLLAPLMLAAHDAANVDGTHTPDPIALLESVKRYADRTTVFCQAGAIHVPSSYQRLVSFAEGMAVEVTARAPGRLFHPKIWVLRFRDELGTFRHRFLCLSRNLTTDRSWDTVLRLDEMTTPLGASPDAAPLADFLKDLPRLTTRPLGKARRDDVASLARSVRKAQFGLPSGFGAAEFWPLGTASGRAWPFPDEANRFAAITPFLDAGFLASMPASRQTGRIVSRPETFNRVGSGAVPTSFTTWTLQRAAETTELEGAPGPADPRKAGTAESQTRSAFDVTTGLHAKTFVWETTGGASVLTGSANGTMAAFQGNVEFDVLLTGPTSKCGWSALFGDDSSEGVGFSQVIEPYEIPDEEGVEDASFAAEVALETFHAELAASGIQLSALEEGRGWTLTASVPARQAPTDSSTTIRPLGRVGGALPLSAALVWRGMAEQNISPFMVLDSLMSTQEGKVRKTCVVKAELLGDPEGRLKLILKDLLASEREILRYLALLLGDPAFDAMVAGLGQGEDGDREKTKAGRPAVDTSEDLVVFEPLARAVARRDDSLSRVDALLRELEDVDGKVPHLSAEFMKLWETAWTAAEELR